MRVMFVEIGIVKEQAVVNMLKGYGREEVDWWERRIDLKRLWEPHASPKGLNLRVLLEMKRKYIEIYKIWGNSEK